MKPLIVAAAAAVMLVACLEPDCVDVCETDCTTDRDCGIAGGECLVGYCNGGSCDTNYASSGTPCSLGVCDDRGGCVECVSAEQCGGAPCADGRCFASSCGDGELGGDETDVDCGGSCPACDLGQRCATGADCPERAVCDAGSICRAPTAPGALALGDEHSCAVRGASVYCWGSSEMGRLGFAGQSSSSPRLVSDIPGSLFQVAAGRAHTCVVTEEGVACFGEASSGDVPGISVGVTSLAAGGDHDCAALVTGAIRCWGRDATGQLGDGPGDSTGADAVLVAGAETWDTVATGEAHSCGLTRTGEVLCWGANDAGQIGDGTTSERPEPTAVDGLVGTPSGIAVGPRQSCAFFEEGGARCWGRNDRGRDGGTTEDALVPVAVPGLDEPLDAMAVGTRHVCALTQERRLLCWGANDVGQLGDGTLQDRASPVEVDLAFSPADPFVAVEAGAGHTCAMTFSEHIHCWGQNELGQLGDGTTADRASPAAVRF